ncbi:MAG: cytochrome c oxidase subunit 3 [Halioglobus sp.]|nr:cytochrome c oxidase subunit 3 [Halioglobus sp.]
MRASTATHPGLNLGNHHTDAHDKAETLVFGFWVFLMSDLIIFGLMFALYLTAQNPLSYAGGPSPKDVYDLGSAFAQTMLLLCSSLTFGFAGLALRHKLPLARVKFWLVVTLLLGLGFLSLELNDFHDMFTKGAVPSRSGHLSAFFGLVPLHGLHVTAGSIWIVIMLLQLHFLGPHPMVKIRLLRLGLFWHFLDIIWIGIFSIVYLGGLA